jgi:hypothetical protein
MNTIDSIHVAPTTTPQTQPGRFEAALQGAAASLGRGVVSTVELAAPYLPGGTVLSAAIRPIMGGAGGAGGAGVLASAAARGASGGSGDDVLAATRALQQESQAFNLQYLQLQEDMQRESREFTAISNVMKVRHDSAKAAIQNIH